MQTPLTAGGSRRVLKRLRDLMAGGGSGQERLNHVVKIIAADLVAEVCSIYIMRAGEVLELFATQGLKQEAVHQTRLAVGEGIVGDIASRARPLALADAQSHPNFAYRPETGEEVYHSMLGVPILRGGRVLGVLVVQNRTFRDYDEEEIETLQTIAMVLAELVSGSDLITPEDTMRADLALAPARLDGLRLNDGIAIGRAVLHQPRVSIRQMVADNPDLELKRLDEALSSMHSAIDDMLASSEMAEGGEHREILESYRMFAEDSGWLGRIGEAIRTGLTAEAAVQRVQDDTRVRMNQITDPYIRERLSDLEDLANRLLRHLTGDRTAARNEMVEDAILVARSMGPAELLDYDRAKIKGVLLEEGSPTAHVAIVARALGIPMVGRVKDVLRRVEPLDVLVVDGDHAQIVLRPSEDVREAFASAVAERAAREAALAALRDLPAVTRDGVEVSLYLNAGLLIDLMHLEETGALRDRLYPTDLPVMLPTAVPDLAAQADLYGKDHQRTAGNTVV
jgi:phosphotransferase system enzyme I (PtsP)